MAHAYSRQIEDALSPFFQVGHGVLVLYSRVGLTVRRCPALQDGLRQSGQRGWRDVRVVDFKIENRFRNLRLQTHGWDGKSLEMG